MNLILLICICFATVCFCVFMIYCIILLVQARLILKEITSIFQEINIRVRKINNSIDAATELWDGVFLRLNSILSGSNGFFSIISNFSEIIRLFRKKDAKEDV